MRIESGSGPRHHSSARPAPAVSTTKSHSPSSRLVSRTALSCGRSISAHRVAAARRASGSPVDPEGPACQPVREVFGDLDRLVLLETLLDDEPGEEAGIDPPYEIVARRDGQQRAGVVVEADGVGEAGRLGDELAEPPDA